MVKVETIPISTSYTDVTERLKSVKHDENVMAVISQKCYEDLAKMGLDMGESYRFDGDASLLSVRQICVFMTDIWVTRAVSYGTLPWYTVIAIKEQGKEKKVFSRKETGKLIIFDVK